MEDQDGARPHHASADCSSDTTTPARDMAGVISIPGRSEPVVCTRSNPQRLMVDWSADRATSHPHRHGCPTRTPQRPPRTAPDRPDMGDHGGDHDLGLGLSVPGVLPVGSCVSFCRSARVTSPPVPRVASCSPPLPVPLPLPSADCTRSSGTRPLVPWALSLTAQPRFAVPHRVDQRRRLRPLLPSRQLQPCRCAGQPMPRCPHVDLVSGVRSVVVRDRWSAPPTAALHASTWCARRGAHHGPQAVDVPCGAQDMLPA